MEQTAAAMVYDDDGDSSSTLTANTVNDSGDGMVAW